MKIKVTHNFIFGIEPRAVHDRHGVITLYCLWKPGKTSQKFLGGITSGIRRKTYDGKKKINQLTLT